MPVYIQSYCLWFINYMSFHIVSLNFIFSKLFLQYFHPSHILFFARSAEFNGAQAQEGLLWVALLHLLSLLHLHLWSLFNFFLPFFKSVSDVLIHFFFWKGTLPNLSCLWSMLCIPSHPIVMQAIGVCKLPRVFANIVSCLSLSATAGADPSAVNFEMLVVLVSYPFSYYTGVTHHVNQIRGLPTLQNPENCIFLCIHYNDFIKCPSASLCHPLMTWFYLTWNSNIEENKKKNWI